MIFVFVFVFVFIVVFVFGFGFADFAAFFSFFKGVSGDTALLNKIDFSKKIAFLFGSEASGLSNNEISYANCSVQIPTNPEFKSLNLSHSVIIIAQFVANLIKLKKSKYSKSKKIKSASKKDILSMANFCIKNLEKRT